MQTVHCIVDCTTNYTNIFSFIFETFVLFLHLNTKVHNLYTHHAESACFVVFQHNGGQQSESQTAEAGETGETHTHTHEIQCIDLH